MEKKSTSPQVVFTLDQLKLLSKTLGAIEHMARTSKPLPNVQFALATVLKVQAKIQSLIQLNRWDIVVGLDENEMLILRTSVQIHMTMLEMLDPSPEGEEVKRQCEELFLLLNPVLPYGRTHD